MKTSEKNILIEKITFDKNLGAPHIRILLWAMRKKHFTAKNIVEELEMTLQQTNKCINELINFEYMRKIGKMESGRVLFYSLDPNSYAKNEENAPK